MTEGTGEGTGTGAGTGAVDRPAWIAQLPKELVDNPSFTAFKTIGDLAKSHIELTGKAKEVDDLKAKLDGSIPKLKTNATDQEKNAYYVSLGRPEKAEGYEFTGENLMPQTVELARKAFFDNGLTKDQGKAMQGLFSSVLTEMINAQNQDITKAKTEAENKLKAEYGDKYSEKVELARRVLVKVATGTDGKPDNDFLGFLRESKLDSDPRLIKVFINLGKIIGEDSSPAGSPAHGDKTKPGIVYDKSPEPPKKSGNY